MVKKLKFYKNFKVSNIYKNSILLVGNFDGFHLGHQKLFNLAKKYKKKFRLKIGVITFEPMPKMYFNKNLKNFRISNVSSGTSGGWFNLADGTMHTQNGAGNVSSIVSVGNGWYRCSRKFAAVIAGANQVLFSPSSADNTTNAINGGVMYLWGAQVNEGVLTPYRKTEASASTTIERGELSKDFYDATHVGF